ncbi:integrase domain protein [Shigella flexneri K-218]|uniref:Putative phage integrase n=1 Tax=Shigella boydii 4444-74 TaxID=766140 RepID=I6EVI7_SHIBO|nr:integrase domain protein [Shigella flexneri K-218]EHV66724.1 putative phage integrase [Escherichia coli DEC6C]EIQ48029.1 putative phage integrase [Shigella boydii 4444-74]
MQLRDITESKIYSAMQKMTNRRHEENWKLRAEACRKKGNLFQNTRQNQRPLQRRLRIFHL